MNVLVIGSGGREHTIVWKLKQSRHVDKVFCLPGNGGISQIAECINIPLTDFKDVADFVRQNKIELTIVGPEAALVAGIVDYFNSLNLKIFGPVKKSAQLEGSKIFAKEFMMKYNIPTAEYRQFSDYDEAVKFVEHNSDVYSIIKADGLCAGKGVFVCKSKQDAVNAVSQCLKEKVFGAAGEKIIIERKLSGEEVSLLCFCDGHTIVPLPLSQDHKRVNDNDEGPNTGGMGAYAPVKFVNEKTLKLIKQNIITNFIKGIQHEKMEYAGVIYFGLMIDSNGIPGVLEFNVRFGDPETQVVLPLLEYDLVELVLAAIDKKLPELDFLFGGTKSAVCVVLASGGYPGSFKKGIEIEGLDSVKDGMVFHAGTKRIDNKIVTDGGRALGVTGIGATLQEAINNSYKIVSKIQFSGMHYRKDIAKKGLK